MDQVIANEGTGEVKAQFSFYMSVSTDAPSKLIFGEYDLKNYAKKGATDADI